MESDSKWRLASKGSKQRQQLEWGMVEKEEGSVTLGREKKSTWQCFPSDLGKLQIEEKVYFSSFSTARTGHGKKKEEGNVTLDREKKK